MRPSSVQATVCPVLEEHAARYRSNPAKSTTTPNVNSLDETEEVMVSTSRNGKICETLDSYAVEGHRTL
jgi:DNA-binding PucR family transcriptional regulator